MKKNIVFILIFLGLLLVLVFVSYLFMAKNKYKFNDNVKYEDLINLYYEDEKVKVCENCLYMCSNWDNEATSMLLKYDGKEYETISVYDNNFKTQLDVGIGDYYQKVLSYYGIKDNYAYWNVEFENGDIYFYNYPSDIIFDKDVSNAYLRFIYYLDNEEWKLLEASSAKKIDSLDIDEYVMFTFEFSFNGNSETVKDKTVASYSIFYKKN